MPSTEPSAESVLAQPFGSVGALIGLHARGSPRHPALIQGDESLDYGELDRLMDRVACGLRERGVQAGDAIAIHARDSLDYAVIFLGALRAGVVAALVPTSVTSEAADAMARDSGAKRVFGEGQPLAEWLGREAGFAAPALAPGHPFNIIYSSGTTGAPKGIVQPHAMRWAHMQRALAYGYDRRSVTLLATPLYSNTTLVAFFPTLAMGGTVVLMGKFDAAGYLALAERHRATHTMLVPVQYQRLMALEDFGRHDLASFRMKLSTSAPFHAELKRRVLQSWPGDLVEYYGMTEGGATCVLWASRDRHKLHTVGRPAPNVLLRLIDEQGREAAPGEAGEIVGHSVAMMTGYHNRPEETRAAEWFDAEGRRYIRTGDVGRLDEEGFVTLVDRRKDMIISGGFNVFPSDLEAVLREHGDVADAAVVGMPSQRWGETPMAFVVGKPGRRLDPAQILEWANQRLGKVQRLAAVELVDELPRSAIGKVLKTALKAALQSRLRL